MLDVHAPHQRVHGFIDFLVHLLTITIGLLIALGLEGWVTHIHHNHLVEEARSNIASEIADNHRGMADRLASIQRSETEAKNAVDVLRKILHNRSAAKGSTFGYHWASSPLAETSWSTAQITGATGFMSYAEVKRYSEIYDSQKEFLAIQQRTLETTLDLGYPMNPGTATDQELAQLIHGLGVAILHYDAMESAAKSLDGLYVEALHR